MSGDMSGTSDLANQLLKLSRILAMSKKHGMTYAVWDRDISNTEAAAIALEAKEAEIAVKTQAVADMARTIAEFQERVKELEAEAPRLLTEQRRTLCAEHDKDIQKLRRAKEIILDMEARAETAERKLAEARAALKAFTAYTVKAITVSEEYDYCVHVVCSADDQPRFAHFRAARAVIEKE